MSQEKERKVFAEHIARKHLKHSAQRQAVLDIFLRVDRHLTAEELHRIARKIHPTLGLTTIYRTLALLRECGLCRDLKFEDGTTRYEHLYAHQHHDHLICTQCGRFVEVVDTEIERLQRKLVQQHGFHFQSHRMDLYGICADCHKRKSA